MNRAGAFLLALLVLPLAACSAQAEPSVVAPTTPVTASPRVEVGASPSPETTSAPSEADATAPLEPSPTTPASTPEATPTPSLRATRLVIPALGLDAPVGESHVVPRTSSVPEGCPAPPPGGTTLTVPNEGIVTPEATFDGAEQKAWIFGHSRWQGVPGLFFDLQHLEVGHELLVTGFDRFTGAAIDEQRFIVRGLYLSDTESGGALIYDGAAGPQVVLQTSVRERGDRPWILDRTAITAKAEAVLDGDPDDPCKYLLLFVVATPA